MKKILLFSLCSIILLVIGLYIFLPKNIEVNQSFSTKSSKGAFTRMLLDTNSLSKWLPKEAKKINKNTFQLNGIDFGISYADFMNPQIRLLLNNPNDNVIAANDVKDSLILNWIVRVQTNNNILDRIKLQSEKKRIKTTVNLLLKNMGTFLSETKNVYGIVITKTSLQDSTLLTLKQTLNHYPTVQEIYTSIIQLQSYAATKSATATRPPMLNIMQDGSVYHYMVALPINKDLPNTNTIIAKRMLAGGKFLETEIITGGFYTMDKWLYVLENFRIDQSYISPAIPFQSLITDRSKEADTTKWQTKLYYPIF